MADLAIKTLQSRYESFKVYIFINAIILLNSLILVRRLSIVDYLQTNNVSYNLPTSSFGTAFPDVDDSVLQTYTTASANSSTITVTSANVSSANASFASVHSANNTSTANISVASEGDSITLPPLVWEHVDWEPLSWTPPRWPNRSSYAAIVAVSRCAPSAATKPIEFAPRPRLSVLLYRSILSIHPILSIHTYMHPPPFAPRAMIWAAASLFSSVAPHLLVGTGNLCAERQRQTETDRDGQRQLEL